MRKLTALDEFIGFFLFFGPVMIVIVAAIITHTVAEMRREECPPYYECSGSARTNHPNCECWDER